MENLIESAEKLELNYFISQMKDFINYKQKIFSRKNNKLVNKFNGIYKNLPDIETNNFNLKNNFVSVGKKEELSFSDYGLLFNSLKKLIPWRKGPFKIFDIEIDSEWNSYLKWQRIEKK